MLLLPISLENILNRRILEICNFSWPKVLSVQNRKEITLEIITADTFRKQVIFRPSLVLIFICEFDCKHLLPFVEYSNKHVLHIFSADNSATDVTDLDDDGGIWGPDFRRSALYRYQRPGSRAFSLPSRLGLSE